MREDESENWAKSSRKWFRFVHDGQLKMPLLPCKKILENLPSHPAPGIWWFIDKKLNVISIQGILIALRLSYRYHFYKIFLAIFCYVFSVDKKTFWLGL